MRGRLRMLFPLLGAGALAACGDDRTAEAPTQPKSSTQTITVAPPSSAPAPGSTTPGATVTTGSIQAASGTGLQKFQGRDYTSGPVVVRLNPDQTFQMRTASGDRGVEGHYAYQNGILTFSDPKGDTGDARFPLRCRLQDAGAENSFQLGEVEGSCTRFRDLTFKSAG